MAWFKKKKEVKEKPKSVSTLPELPDLPRLPKLPELPELPETTENPLETGNESRSLPTFSGKIGEDFSQEAIKSAVSPAPPVSPPQVSILNSKKEKIKRKRTLEIPGNEFQASPSLPVTTKPALSKKIEPVYIQIDKFKTAILNFEEIQNKIKEVESFLQKIKEIKQKEDEELRQWEQELETIKSRMYHIDNSIFSKLN